MTSISSKRLWPACGSIENFFFFFLFVFYSFRHFISLNHNLFYFTCTTGPPFYFTSVIAFCFALCFTSLLSQSSRHASGHIDIVTSLASHFAFGHFITHTHTLSLSLTHFPFSLCFLAQCHLSALRHTPQPHATHLGLSSRFLAAHHTSPLCITHLGFSFSLWFLFYFCFSTLVLAFLHSVTSRLYVTRLGLTSHISASHYMPRFAFLPFRKP